MNELFERCVAGLVKVHHVLLHGTTAEIPPRSILTFGNRGEAYATDNGGIDFLKEHTKIFRYPWVIASGTYTLRIEDARA